MVCVKCSEEIPEQSNFCPWCGKAQVKKQGTKKRANGTGSVYKRGNTWVAEFRANSYDEEGKLKYNRSRKCGFKTKTSAIEHLHVLSEEVSRHKNRIAPTVAELWDRYSKGEMLKKSKSIQTKYKIAYDRWTPLKGYKIDEIVTADLQKVVADAVDTYYPAKDMRDLMSNLYKIALPDQYISSNLAPYITLPDLEPSEPEPYTTEEILAIWADYGEGNMIAGYMLLMIYSGMMPGELCNLRKDNIDWEKSQILGIGLKTKERKTTPIAIADFIVPVLADLCEKSRGDKVLTMNRWNFYTEFHETEKKIGIRDLTPYACRHTTATALAAGNIAPSVIQKVMRHAKFTTTERYIHISSDLQREAINTIAPATNK